MPRNPNPHPWPPATVIEEAQPVTHWNAARPGATALWPVVPPRPARYLNRLLDAHVLSVYTDESAAGGMTRGPRR